MGICSALQRRVNNCLIYFPVFCDICLVFMCKHTLTVFILKELNILFVKRLRLIKVFLSLWFIYLLLWWTFYTKCCFNCKWDFSSCILCNIPQFVCWWLTGPFLGPLYLLKICWMLLNIKNANNSIYLEIRDIFCWLCLLFW